MIKPIFIFSLPRSGSTLLQRILVSHEKISSAAEPWVLLPFTYPLKKDGVYAEYSHALMHAALNDFCGELPNGRSDYLEAVGHCIMELYQKAADQDSVYFLDKTPRYALVCDEIMQALPDAKVIFLWRNPLAVIASMIETWGKGRWNLDYYKVDLYSGLSNLVDYYQKNDDKVLAVDYEAFICNPREELDRIAHYLGLQFDDEILESFSSVSFKGDMGDPTGTKKYKAVSKEPLEKWKSTVCNPYRKWWCRRYLNWIGPHRLRIMGYDDNQLVSELDGIPFSIKYLLSDIVRVCYGFFYRLVSPTILKAKLKGLMKGKPMMNYN